MARYEILILLALIIILAGFFLGWKGKTSMIRERFASGVSPKNERKFMMCYGRRDCCSWRGSSDFGYSGDRTSCK